MEELVCLPSALPERFGGLDGAVTGYPAGSCLERLPAAIGRRNFLFSGSNDAAARLCAACTLVVGAKRHGIDPFVYVKDLLDRLERGWKIDRVAGLTPRRWAAAQAAK